MDMTPHRRPRLKAADRQSALDYPMLVALLNAAQGSGPAAFAPVIDGGEPTPAAAEDCFVDLIEGGPAWRRAILGQGGSFNRDVAEREIDPPQP
ncbi:hypothetical protein [Allosphingosinicella vermicomposti]|uniref:hypothetical protein n=1 Tax=Allosphingosinicella vermicomposti TaxID=614671 RepID=UPI000D0E47F9|nr:hypothetical protein [Allosphingosinicella vermicomposti]